MASLSTEQLKVIIADQQEEAIFPEDYFQRTSEAKIDEFSSNKEIIVLMGLRRSGKSVLLQHVRNQSSERDYYFNFEDERLVNFTVEDFQTLQHVFIELFGQQKTFYFDEIQNIPGWELFVRRLYNNGHKIYLTGSNANLFSEELGTRLTGRYIPVKIYPFSFYEFVQHNEPHFSDKQNFSTSQIGHMKQLFSEYVKKGGIPEYVKYEETEYLHALYESIIYRDIMARYKLTNEKALKELVFYLASNCSKEMTYNSLRKLLNLGSGTTVSDYCSYLENSFLCFFINRYSPSLKSQMRSPKKVYFIDHVLAKTVGFHFSEDRGRMLENIVFLELKRKGVDIYYHNEKKECDFVVRESGKMISAIQVCQQLTESNKKREYEGLLEALETYALKTGYIITESEESSEVVSHNGHTYTIIVVPVWKWLLSVDFPSLHRKS